MRTLVAPAGCLLLALVAACGGPGGGPPQDRGAVVYSTHCAACHQRDGRGASSAYPPLASSTTVNGDPDTLVAWLLFGKRPTTLPPRKGLAVMPQLAWLSDDDVAAVLTHVRTRFGNGSSPVSPAQVAAVRAAGAGH